MAMVNNGTAETNYDYDLVVIGGGSGGLAAAKQAGKLGKKVRWSRRSGKYDLIEFHSYVSSRNDSPMCRRINKMIDEAQTHRSQPKSIYPQS